MRQRRALRLFSYGRGKIRARRKFGKLGRHSKLIEDDAHEKKYYFSSWCLPRTWPVLEGVDATAKTRLHEPYNLLYQPLKIKLLKITVIMKTKVFINILSQIVCSCINLFAVLYAATSSSPFQLWQRENSSTTKVFGPPLKINRR